MPPFLCAERWWFPGSEEETAQNILLFSNKLGGHLNCSPANLNVVVCRSQALSHYGPGKHYTYLACFGLEAGCRGGAGLPPLLLIHGYHKGWKEGR